MEHETQQALGWFNSDGFIPHGHCYLWEPELLWTLVISDSVIALSYFTIPFGLMYFVSKRPDLKFNWMFKLFSVFILACGITHLYDVWTIWHPDYWPMAFAKAITAAASLLTAGLLWPLIPRAIKLPSTSQLESLNAQLLVEIEQRKLYETELTALKSNSDTRYRILFESSRDALLVTAPDGRFLSGNPAAIALLGCLNESDFTALTPAKVSPEFQPDGRRSDEKAQEMIRLALESGSHTFEWMHQRVDGVPFTTEVLLTRVELDNKILLQASVRDISERKRAEQLIKEEKAFSDTLILSLPDVFYLFDQQGNMLRWSHKGLEMFGLSAEEMSRTNVMDLVYEEDRPLVTTKLQQVFETGSARVEARLNLKDGVHDYILSARSIKTQHGVNVVGVGVDITERKVREMEIERLNRLYAVLSEVNQAIVRLPSRDALFERVCQVVVEQGGFRMAWIGWHDPETQLIMPVADWGDENGYLQNIKIYGDDRPEGRGPTGTAFRTGRPYISNDMSNDDTTLPWRAEMERRGFRAAAVFPIRLQGAVRGTMSVYSEEKGFFQDKEVALLTEATADISFALDNIERKEAHKRAEEANEQTLKRLTEAQRIGQIGDWELDLATGAITWSLQTFEIFGRDPGLGPPRSYEEHAAMYEAASAALMSEKVAAAIASGDAQEYELVAVRPDGRRVPVQAMAVPRKDAAGKVVSLTGTVQDVTARKEGQRLVRESEERLRVAIEAAELGTWDLDLTTDIAVRSLREYEIWGYRELQPEWGLEIALRHVPPEDHPIVLAAMACAAATGVFAVEIRVLWPDGSIHWIASHGRVRYDSDGIPARMMGVSADITERKQKEAKLAEQLEELRRWHIATSGREERILSLKHEVNELLEQAGQLARYPSAEP